ncbi:hypothetical protein [Hymenobacter terrestris]|uniref:Uncharacterized protein n=1 Tax=Hymenobacter terrestris TaxID=2748310 RepID=A0ABX2Q0R6_9BACT|nr:hypothetical protein [Hymenobacter terrestris]NVO83339.1 hypothetical protein [Hymenobacter terrestris]
MANRILYDTPVLTISVNYIDDWLYLDWHGRLTDEDIVPGALRLLELLKQEGCAKILNDNTHVSGLWADAAKWGSDVLFPQLHAAGCRYFSWVHSPERYSQLSAELAMQQTSAGITFMSFQDLSTAAARLRRM